MKKEELLRSLERQSDANADSFSSFLGDTLVIDEEWTYMCDPNRRVCCGRGHKGCRGFTLVSGAPVFIRRYFRDMESLHQFHEFIIETEDGEFLIPLYRLLLEIGCRHLTFVE